MLKLTLLPITADLLRSRIQANEAIQPEARRNAIAESFAEVCGLPGAPVGEPSEWLRYALDALAHHHDGANDPRIVARRATLLRVVEALKPTQADMDALATEAKGQPFSMDLGQPRVDVRWFQCQIDAWKDSSDPRHRQMAETAARELAELQQMEAYAVAAASEL